MDRLEFLRYQENNHPEMCCTYTKIPEWVKVGSYCRIKKGVQFSPQGFGFEKVDGKWLHIPHSGKVIIGNEVEIFEGTNIVRATADDGTTEIGDGTKIDYGVHVAHNVKIGKNCLVVAGTIIGGSTVIGNDCYLGIGCMIKNRVKIGNGVTVGMGAVVLKDIPDGETWVGNPARKL